MDGGKVEASTLDVIRPVLPAGGDVHSMLDTRECLNNQSWSDQLNPLWLTSSIEKYGGSPTIKAYCLAGPASTCSSPTS